MNDTLIEMEPQREQSLRTLGHVSYALHAIVALGAVLPGVQGSVLLLVIAFGLDLYKRDEARGSWQESHFRWRIRSVLFCGLAYLLTAPLWFPLIFPGWIAWGVVSLWFAWRIVRGWLNLSDHRPMPVPA